MPADPFEHTSMPLGDHLEELRKRILWGIVGVLPIFIAGLVYGRTLFGLIATPVMKVLADEGLPRALQSTGPLEGFMSFLKVAFLVTAVLGAPWILYQGWRFVAPGLYSKEQRFVQVLAPLSVILSIAGLAFVYYIVLPMTLHFFVHFNATLIKRTVEQEPAPAGITFPSFPTLDKDPESPAPGTMWINRSLNELRVAVPRAIPEPTKDDPKPDEPAPKGNTPAAGTPAKGESVETSPVVVLGMRLTGDSMISQEFRLTEYFSLVLTFTAIFALTFQTPVVVLLLGWAGIIHPVTMKKHRKHVFFGCAVLSAIVTPPDFLSMFLLLIPLYALFELGLLMLQMFPAKRVAALGTKTAG